MVSGRPIPCSICANTRLVISSLSTSTPSQSKMTSSGCADGTQARPACFILMADSSDTPPPALLAHGAEQLSLVTVETYNAELRTSDGFIGDRASKRAFQTILDEWRERMRKAGEDPLGDAPSDELSKKQLDKLLVDGDAEAAGVIHAAIEGFAQEFATVVRRLLRLKCWKDTERIVVGGGLRHSRIGELAIGRTAV